MHAFARLWLLVVAMLLASMSAAFAHAQLLDTSPADNAVVQTAPDTVSLRFNEPVTPLAIKLFAPDGSATGLLDMTTGGETVTIPLPVEIGNGTSVLSWRVVSTDGHPISGSLVFSIGRVTGAAVTETSDQAVSIALWAAKTALFIAMFVGIGGAYFSAIAPLPRRARTIVLVLSGLGAFVVPLTLGLQGLDALGLPIPSLMDVGVWRAGLATSYGATAIEATIAFAFAIFALQSRWACLAIVAGVLAALGLALSGHASAADPQWLTRPAVFLHIAALLFWIGALVPLWCLLRDETSHADRALARFSKAIPLAVAALLLSGLVLGIVQMGRPGPQWLSPYAAILAAKLSLLMLLFIVALVNRIWLTKPAIEGNRVAVQRLRRSIAAELLIVIIILGLVAGWRFTPPPRALATQISTAEPVLVHAMDDNLMAIVTITPGSPGPVSMDIQLTDLDYAPVDAQSINVTLSSPSLGIEPMKRIAEKSDTGWHVTALTIPVAGDWQLDLDIRVSRFALTKLQTEVSIP